MDNEINKNKFPSFFNEAHKKHRYKLIDISSSICYCVQNEEESFHCRHDEFSCGLIEVMCIIH